jgi:hypothetical protein
VDKPRCETCPYWDLDTLNFRSDSDEAHLPMSQLIPLAMSDGRLVLGECRRYPPAIANTDDPEGWSHFPRTSQSDYCGEHPSFSAYLASLANAQALA